MGNDTTTTEGPDGQTAALLDALYSSAPIGLGFWDRELRYVRVNEALAAINDRSPADHVGRTFAEVVPELAGVLEPLVRGVLETGVPVVGREITSGTPGHPTGLRHWSASYYPVTRADGERIGVGAVVEEITARRRAEQLTELQHETARILAEVSTLEDAVPRILEAICRTSHWDVACYWSTDDDDGARFTWAAPGVRVEGFLALTERAAPTPAMLPGRVVETGASEWLPDLAPERFLRAPVAAAEGLRSGVAFPVAAEGHVAGVVELYSLVRREPDAALTASLEALGTQLGQLIRRTRVEEERARLLHRERQARAGAEAAAATLRKLERVAEATLEHLSLRDLLDALLARIVEVLDADTAAILLIGDDGHLHVRSTVGLAEEARPRPIPFGEGMAGRVAASRAPLLVPDLSTVELASPVLRERGVNSLVAIPLVVEDRVIGVVHAGSEAYAQFVEDDARLLELIADRIALAINQASLYEAERAAQERLAFLAEASALLAASLDLERTLNRVAQLAVPHFADWCAVDLVEQDGHLQRVAVAHVDPDRVDLAHRLARAFPATLDDDRGIGAVVRSGEALLVNDIDEDQLRTFGAGRPSYLHAVLRLAPRAAIVAPLVVRERTVGALSFVSAESGRRYGTTDLAFARELASRAAVAVDNARLYRAAQLRRDQLAFLAEASALLGSSLDVDRTLEQLGALLAARFSDWTAIDLVGDDGAVRLATVAHRDPERTGRARAAVAGREPPPAVRAAVEGARTVTWQAADGGAAIGLGDPGELHSGLVVPLVARGRVLGTLSLLRGETPEQYDEDDLEFAEDIAHRAAVALDNAQLYRAAEERAQAARVLASVGDGVFLVDSAGCIRIWNEAAAAATGLPAASVLDRPAGEAIPGWDAVRSRIPVGTGGGGQPRAESLPLGLGGRELWLSIHGVAVPDGVVYAFRDLTEERALEQMRAEFVSTVSHELRTPLAAIYGAAMTLRRSDVALDDEQRERLLDVVSGEADRLARTVNDILWASRLDSDTLHVAIQNCDPVALVEEVLVAQAAHLDPAHRLAVDAAPGLPPVAGDPDKVGRVLINLVDNAVKYSPGGGRVAVSIAPVGSHVRFSVADEGLGIPAAEQRRVFEKFYRLDPNMNQGVGGTGLGLYICRELVRRMDGRIWVESPGLGRGSTFHVELPAAAPGDL